MSKNIFQRIKTRELIVLFIIIIAIIIQLYFDRKGFNYLLFIPLFTLITFYFNEIKSIKFANIELKN